MIYFKHKQKNDFLTTQLAKLNKMHKTIIKSGHNSPHLKQLERNLKKAALDIQQEEEKQVAEMIMRKMETIKSSEQYLKTTEN